VLDPARERHIEHRRNHGKVTLVLSSDTVPETVNEDGGVEEVDELLGEGDDAAEGEGADGARLVVFAEEEKGEKRSAVVREGEWWGDAPLPVVLVTVKPSHSAVKNESTSLARATGKIGVSVRVDWKRCEKSQTHS
jgi:hypothetical protein